MLKENELRSSRPSELVQEVALMRLSFSLVHGTKDIIPTEIKVQTMRSVQTKDYNASNR